MPDLIAAVTGHRPDKLYGYDLKAEPYWKLRNYIYVALKAYGASGLWTGMALGADQVAALTVLDLKNENYDISLNAAIPFKGQESKWRQESVMLYNAILSKCDKRHVVSAGGYSGKAMQDRNIFMTDRADYIIAIWNGSSGGTGNCVKYALSKNIPVLQITPSLSTTPAWLNRPAGFMPEERPDRRPS